MIKYKSQAKRESVLKRMHSGLTELDFVNSIAQSQSDSKSYSEDEHHMAELLINKKWKRWKVANVPYYEKNNLLFYHWYERRYNKNVINLNVLKNLFQSAILTWNDNYSEEEIEEYLNNNLISHMSSKRFPNYSKYYEFYFDLLPDIEKFEYEEFRGAPFLNYLIKLFPKIKSINYMDRKSLLRFTKAELQDHTSMYRTHDRVIYSKYRLPGFSPSVISEEGYNITCWGVVEKSVRRVITNELRVARNLPKVGEGWISETKLFYDITKVFPELEVKHHGNPHWLGRQHFDIYFPDLNIAIEYQGTQHQKPVEYFGGEEAFVKGKERDERKKKLCDENGCKLFYVYPDDDTKKFIKELKKYIKNNH